MNIRDQLLEAAESYDAAGLDGECGADMCRTAVAALIAAEEMADAIDAYESAETAAGDTGLEDDYHFVFECWDVVQAKKAAYRAATGAA